MSRNGSGTYTLPAGNPVVTGTTISSSWANTTLSDIATALTQSIAYNGVTTPIANLPMGGYGHTGVADATALTMYASANQVENGTLNYLTSVAGTNTITATAPLSLAAYSAGQTFRFIAAGANTGATTLNLNSLGAKSIVKTDGSALSSGDIASGAAVVVMYDGTNFQLLTDSNGNTETVTNLTVTGTLTASGTITGTGFSTYLASPPAIGGTTAAAGTFTNLAYTGTLTGSTGIMNIGSGQLYKDGSGNVGIGTSSPDSVSGYTVLETKGTTGSNGGILQSRSADATIKNALFCNSSGGYVGTRTNHALIFNTNDTERMRIDTSGNVGIGTSSPNSNSGFTVLTLNNASNGGMLDLNANGTRVTTMYTTSAGGYLGTVTSTPMQFITNATERMRIDSAGRVGIGRTPTANGLEVSTGIGWGINQEGFLTYDGTNAYLQSSGALIFRTSGANERMRIDSSGNVLVGTTSPATPYTARFNCAITGASWAGQFENNNTAYDTILCVNHATSGNNRFIGFGTEASYTERGYIYYDRAAGQTKLSATSDYRAKDIEGLTENALDIVNAIPVHNAKLKWAEGIAYPMFLAHELQEIASWAVSGEKDAVNEEGNPIYQTVSYESMVATLTKAIQEQQALITQLQADVAALKNGNTPSV